MNRIDNPTVTHRSSILLLAEEDVNFLEEQGLDKKEGAETKIITLMRKLDPYESVENCEAVLQELEYFYGIRL